MYKQTSKNGEITKQRDMVRSDKWLLKFHPNKCKVMTVSNKSGNNREQKYHLNDSEGKEVELQNFRWGERHGCLS